MIKFSCPKCGKRFKVPDEHAGKKGKCPECKDSILIPGIKSKEQDTSPSKQIIKFRCQTCGGQVEAPEALKGKNILCPNCDSNIEVPQKEISEEKKPSLDELLLEKPTKEKSNITEETRTPKLVWYLVGATAVFLVILVLYAFFLRDTWEIDNYRKISNIEGKASSLVYSGELEKALEKYNELFQFVGERKLKTKDLRQLISDAKQEYSNIKSRWVKVYAPLIEKRNELENLISSNKLEEALLLSNNVIAVYQSENTLDRYLDPILSEIAKRRDDVELRLNALKQDELENLVPKWKELSQQASELLKQEKYNLAIAILGEILEKNQYDELWTKEAKAIYFNAESSYHETKRLAQRIYNEQHPNLLTPENIEKYSTEIFMPLSKDRAHNPDSFLESTFARHNHFECIVSANWSNTISKYYLSELLTNNGKLTWEVRPARQSYFDVDFESRRLAEGKEIRTFLRKFGQTKSQRFMLICLYEIIPNIGRLDAGYISFFGTVRPLHNSTRLWLTLKLSVSETDISRIEEHIKERKPVLVRWSVNEKNTELDKSFEHRVSIRENEYLIKGTIYSIKLIDVNSNIFKKYEKSLAAVEEKNKREKQFLERRIEEGKAAGLNYELAKSIMKKGEEQYERIEKGRRDAVESPFAPCKQIADRIVLNLVSKSNTFRNATFVRTENRRGETCVSYEMEYIVGSGQLMLGTLDVAILNYPFNSCREVYLNGRELWTYGIPFVGQAVGNYRQP